MKERWKRRDAEIKSFSKVRALTCVLVRFNMEQPSLDARYRYALSCSEANVVTTNCVTSERLAHQIRSFVCWYLTASLDAGYCSGSR
jgi:hypothetical protein